MCCGETDKVIAIKDMSNTSAIQKVTSIDRVMRLNKCLNCPNRIASNPNQKGMQDGDMCAWEKADPNALTLYKKAQVLSEKCPKLIWPEPTNTKELSLPQKVSSLVTSVLGAETSEEEFNRRKEFCRTCEYRMPKNGTEKERNPNHVEPNDICMICTCPNISIFNLVNKKCPHPEGSRW